MTPGPVGRCDECCGGTIDGLDLLIADHNRVRGLFARFTKAHENNDAPMISELADQIFAELEVHTALEEQIFYPAVHDLSEELAEVVDEGVQAPRLIDDTTSRFCG